MFNPNSHVLCYQDNNPFPMLINPPEFQGASDGTTIVILGMFVFVAFVCGWVMRYEWDLTMSARNKPKKPNYYIYE